MIEQHIQNIIFQKWKQKNAMWLLIVKTFFDQPINDDYKIYENIRKISTDKGDDYTTGYLLDNPYFKKNYKMITIDLSKQQTLDADLRAIQKINFTANLDREGNKTMLLLIVEAKETVLDFLQGTVKLS